MKHLIKGSLVAIAAGLASLVTSTAALAADYTVTSSGDTGGAALGIGMIVCYLLALVVALVLIVWVAVWVYKDANKRGAPAVLWVVLWLFFGWIALVIYFIARPKEFVGQGGNITPPPPPPPVDPGAGQ